MYKNNHVFVDGKRYKASESLWELITQSRPDENVVTHLDGQAYKQIPLQSNAHRVIFIVPRANSMQATSIYALYFANVYKPKEVPWLNDNVNV